MTELVKDHVFLGVRDITDGQLEVNVEGLQQLGQDMNE
jgi:hypothetical protein